MSCTAQPLPGSTHFRVATAWTHSFPCARSPDPPRPAAWRSSMCPVHGSASLRHLALVRVPTPLNHLRAAAVRTKSCSRAYYIDAVLPDSPCPDPPHPHACRARTVASPVPLAPTPPKHPCGHVSGLFASDLCPLTAFGPKAPSLSACIVNLTIPSA